MNKPKRATIYDIAAQCGVSAATVSRVLSRADYPVSESTRKSVMDAAAELRYTPNLLGKSLKTRSCRDIGVVIPNFTNYSYAALLQGMYAAAAEQQYNLILCNSNRDPVSERENVALLLQKQVAGILIASISAGTESIAYAMDYGVRVVAVEQAVRASCDRVELDFTRGAYLAVEHLISLGHRRIGFMGAPLDRSSRIQMLDGYRRCLREHGIEPDPELTQLAGERTESDQHAVYEFENGRLLADRFLALSAPPTGVIVINDMTALAAVRQFKARGLHVPEDVSVVGFDNIPFCETALPALTTLDQRAVDLGAQAAELLIRGIENPEQPCERVVLEPTLIVRGSTGAPRQA